MVVETDPIPDHTCGVLQGFEPVTMNALVVEESDDPLDDAVLLWAIGRNELLLHPIAFSQSGVTSACQDQTVIRPMQERRANDYISSSASVCCSDLC